MSAVVAVALPIVAELRARDAAWEADAAEWARQGYRPHYCKHGTNLWVEWDAMCPGCEDSLTVHQEALAIAHARVALTVRRTAVMTAAFSAALAERTPLPPDLRDALVAWALEPVQGGASS